MMTDFSAADWMTLGARLVGLTFLWTAVIKAVAPHAFTQHLARLGWVPSRVVPVAVTGVAGLEAGLGAALVLFVAPGIVLPLTIVLLIVLSAISWWGVRSGKASDCGCYGGFIQPSIGQSIALNAMYAALVAIPWLNGERGIFTRGWQVAVTIVVALAVGAFTEVARQWRDPEGKPLVDLNPVKVGRQWRHRWAGNATAGMNGEFVVAYLGPHCPYCADFVRIANAMIQSPSLPRVIGVTAASKEDLDKFVQEKKIRFPVAAISASLMGRLAYAVPTIAVVKDGFVEAHWSGSMPPEFARRFTLAFFPQATKRPEPASVD